MPGSGSGFLRAAAATALGVAGGQLLFQGIESLFGQPASAVFAGQPLQPAISETVTNNYYGGGDRQSAADRASGDSTLDNDDASHDANDTGLDDSDTAWNNGFGSDDTDLV